MPSITGHDILSEARRAHFNVPIYDWEFKPYSVGSQAATTFIASSDLISIVAAATPTASGVELSHTIAAQPDIARTLQVRLVDGSNNNTVTRVVITGKNVHQEQITERLVFTGPGSETQQTNNAFHTVTSVKSYFANSTTTGVTVGVGQGDGLALPADVKSYEDVIEAATEDTTDLVNGYVAETLSASIIDSDYGVYYPTVLPDGTKMKYWISLRSTLGLTEF